MNRLPTPYFCDLQEPHRQILSKFDGTGLRKRAGVYSIKNLNTKKVYVGSSRNIAARILSHRRSLEKNIHHNYRLQASYNKSQSKEVFVVDIGLTDTIATAREREQMMLDEGHGLPWVLNICDQVNGGGDPAAFEKRLSKLIAYSRLDSTRKEKSERSKRLWACPEFKDKMIKKLGESVVVDGIQYNSVREACRAFPGTCPQTIRKYMKDGESVDSRNFSFTVEKKVSVHGIVYDSLVLAAKELGIAPNTLTWRCKNTNSQWADHFYLVENNMTPVAPTGA